MKLSKTFLTGILALALVFGMTLAGCDNGSTDDGGGGGGGGDSLTGSWVNDRNNPTQAFIFTDVADPGIMGNKVVYYITTLTNQNTSVIGGNTLTIGTDTYLFTVNGNMLTVTAYGTAPAGGGTRPDVTFNRAKGTSGTTMHGVWISNLPPTDLRYTLIIIRQGTANIHTAVGGGAWGETSYSLTSNANNNLITWGSNTSSNAYTKDTDPTTLNIVDPNGQPRNGLMPLTSGW
jgi:hypothetical protein